MYVYFFGTLQSSSLIFNGDIEYIFNLYVCKKTEFNKDGIIRSKDYIWGTASLA